MSPASIVIFTNASMMGGMERHVLDLASNFVGRGHPTSVLCFGADAIEPLRSALRDAGVIVHPLRGGHRVIGRWVRFAQLMQILRHRRGAVLQLSEAWPPGDGLVIAAGLLSGMRIVRTEHQGPVLPVSTRRRLLLLLKDLALDRVVCVSHQNRQDFIEGLGRRPRLLDVIPNGIEAPPLVETADKSFRSELGVHDEDVLIGFVGRLTEERKGANQFLAMAALVANEDPASRFVVVGDGLLRSRLEAQALDLGIASRVAFVGWRNDVLRCLRAFDIFVQPSTAEGASYALLEAMATGLAVVATSTGSVPELICDGWNGVVVPVGDVEAMAAAVTRLSRDRELRWRAGKAARATVDEDLSTTRMVDRYLSLYEILRQRR